MSATTIHPYFTAKARAALIRAGGDPGNSTALAAWAQHAKQTEDTRAGVVVAETGEILAETRYMHGRVGASYIRTVTHETDTDLVGREVGLAVGSLARVHGPAVHVRYSEVCQGAGTPSGTFQRLTTLYVDAPAYAVQVVAAEVLGYQPGVGGGRITELTLTAPEAARVAAELRARGYEVTR